MLKSEWFCLVPHRLVIIHAAGLRLFFVCVRITDFIRLCCEWVVEIWQGCRTKHISIGDCQYYTFSIVKFQIYLQDLDVVIPSLSDCSLLSHRNGIMSDKIQNSCCTKYQYSVEYN